MRYHEFRAMNTQVLLAAEGPEEFVETGFHQAQAFIEESEKRFTRFSDQSELAELNLSAGTWFQASADMFELVSLAARLHLQTQGLFDPAILDALEMAGYDRSMDVIREQGVQAPSPVLIRPRIYRFVDVRLEPQTNRIFLPDGMRIDLGGIAKGWIAERAARILSNWVTACAVDAGGDIFFIGVPQGEPHWRVSLEDPVEPDKTLAVLKITGGAVATSSTIRRRWKQDRKIQHHLIDPRTRQPANSDWISVTVIGQHAAEAEVFAKALLIGGPGASSRISRRGEGIHFISVDQQRKLWGSTHSKEFLDD